MSFSYELITKNTYSYNDRGHLTEVNNWTADEGMMLRTVNKYDEKGDVEKILKYDVENNLIEKSIYELDDKARVVKIMEEVNLIISKGQANFECLDDYKNNIIYFLMVVKCEVVADYLGVKKGEYIVKKGG